MNIYVISDLHFGHENILKFERTRFSNIEEHDAFIIESINKVVKVTDILWILGDIGNLDKVRLLNGQKKLIMGNHDKKSKQEYLGFFAEVYNTPIYLNKRVVLSHEPIQVNHSVLNVHGHLHGSILDSINYLNVSVTQVDYYPVNIDKFASMLEKLPKESTNFLEEWYSNLYKFTIIGRNDVVTDTNGRILLEQSKSHRENMKKDYKGFVVNLFEEE